MSCVTSQLAASSAMTVSLTIDDLRTNDGERFSSWSTCGVNVRRRRRRHIAQELIAAMAFERGQVVRNQAVGPLDRDFDSIARKVEDRKAATTVAAERLRCRESDSGDP